MKIVAIIQARMGSTRLPGKVLKQIENETVLFHVVQRVKQSLRIDQIVVATTTLAVDDVIEQESIRLGISCFRGSETDVLSRYYEAAKTYDADVVVRITSDCPLIDWQVIDKGVDIYLDNTYDIVSNAGSDPETRTYPRGLDVEIFGFAALERAFKRADETYMREHVTPYIYKNAKETYFFKKNQDYSHLRWTLDTIEDFYLISKVYEHLYVNKPLFTQQDVLDLLAKQPRISEINQHIEQKKI